MLIGGAFLAVMASATLLLALSRAWLIVVRIAIALGVLIALVGLVLYLNQRRRASRGLDVGLSNGRALIAAGMIACLVLAFLFSILPIPVPSAWMENVLPLICLALAIWLGVRLAHGAAPMDYQHAQRAYQQGDLDAALGLLRGMEAKHPEFHGTYHLQAIIYRERKDFPAAYEAAKRLIALRPELYYGYAELGLTFLEEDRPAEARDPLRRASELAPDLAEGHFNLGMACAEAQDPEGAVAPFRRALRLRLRDEVTEMMARYHLYRALAALGRQAEAEVELRHLRHRAGVLRRWREELGDSARPASDRRREQALIAAIERALKAPRATAD
jgi:tetratricopeptide (TPR) repeat protein